MICLAASGDFGGDQGLFRLGGSLTGLTVWGTESWELRSQARSLGQGSPAPPNQPSFAGAITHAPLSTLTERTLRRPPRSPMFAQSLSSWQRRPWKSSSSQSVRQAGAGPGAGALLMPLRGEKDRTKCSASSEPPRRPRPAQRGSGVKNAGPGQAWTWAARGSPSSHPPPPRKDPSQALRIHQVGERGTEGKWRGCARARRAGLYTRPRPSPRTLFRWGGGS